jgi:hypothetical protein
MPFVKTTRFGIVYCMATETPVCCVSSFNFQSVSRNFDSISSIIVIDLSRAYLFVGTLGTSHEYLQRYVRRSGLTHDVLRTPLGARSEMSQRFSCRRRLRVTSSITSSIVTLIHTRSHLFIDILTFINIVVCYRQSELIPTVVFLCILSIRQKPPIPPSFHVKSFTMNKVVRVLATFAVLLSAHFPEGWALHPSSFASSGPPVESSSLLDVDSLKRTIAQGRVYQHKDFLSEDQVQTMLQEIREMERQNKFERKGLSNTVLGQNQTFDTKLDRSVCVVPWFIDALEGSDTRDIPSKLRELQRELSQALDRPSMSLTSSSLNHECYYSKSEVGSRLPRHMDERHEETKGAKGWLLPSRRSLSWLIYLSTPADWTLAANGGALRSYPQRNVAHDQAHSTHDGNLQVGWLVGDGKSSSRIVYMDSWYPVMGVVVEGSVPEPHCVLYTVDANDQRELLTRPWMAEQVQGLPMMEFMKLCADHDSDKSKEAPLLFLQQQHARAFAPLEDRRAWDNGEAPEGSEAIDIVPLRGSLVVFDSVQLPHQVEIIESGTRQALAGWFHEKTQEFPEDFYSSMV